MRNLKKSSLKKSIVAAMTFASLATAAAASSHREAPDISGDPLVDNTDVYAFRSYEKGKENTLVILANYIPLQKPESGPNFWGFDPDARYEIHIDNDGDAEEDITYRFEFNTKIGNKQTFLYNTGPIANLKDETLNVKQFFNVSRIEKRRRLDLANGLQVGPPNVGRSSIPDYTPLRTQAIASLKDGTRVFAGQRAEQFYLDLGAIFDLLQVKPADQAINSTKMTNVHTIALEIPMELVMRRGVKRTTAETRKGGSDAPNNVVGIWATASRPQITVRRPNATPSDRGSYIQVSRLGMPLVNEVVIPLQDKDKFNRSHPASDGQFLKYVQDPEVPKLLNALFGVKVPPAPRNDLVAVFLTGVEGVNNPVGVKPSEMLRINLDIPPTALESINPLGVVAGDKGGFPNGRRPMDDTVDIVLRAAAGVLVEGFNVAPNNQLGDGVDRAELPFLEVFPFLPDPVPGR